MCPIDADFKHFRRAEPQQFSPRRQGIVNHARQGLVNHAGERGVGDGGLTSLIKPKRKALG
jgi:hypothetical protein